MKVPQSRVIKVLVTNTKLSPFGGFIDSKIPPNEQIRVDQYLDIYSNYLAIELYKVAVMSYHELSDELYIWGFLLDLQNIFMPSHRSRTIVRWCYKQSRYYTKTRPRIKSKYKQDKVAGPCLLGNIYFDRTQSRYINNFSLNIFFIFMGFWGNVNYLIDDEELNPRNVMQESARIAWGQVANLDTLDHANFDALFIHGGFGTAKNHCDLVLKMLIWQLFHKLKKSWKIFGTWTQIVVDYEKNCSELIARPHMCCMV